MSKPVQQVIKSHIHLSNAKKLAKKLKKFNKNSKSNSTSDLAVFSKVSSQQL